MSDFEIAVSRLTAWLRDYQDVKAKEFIGDVTLVLLVAKDSQKTQEQRDELLAALQTVRGHVSVLYSFDKINQSWVNSVVKTIDEAIKKAKGDE